MDVCLETCFTVCTKLYLHSRVRMVQLLLPPQAKEGFLRRSGHLEASDRVGVCHAGKQLTCTFSLKRQLAGPVHRPRAVCVSYTGCSCRPIHPSRQTTRTFHEIRISEERARRHGVSKPVEFLWTCPALFGNGIVYQPPWIY